MTLNAHVIECDNDPSAAPDLVGSHWVNTVNKCHWLAVGTDDVNDWLLLDKKTDFEVTVPGSTTMDLHTTPFASFCSAHYQICMFNSTEDKWRSLMLHGSKKNASSVDDSVFAILGESLNIDLNFNKVATDAVLEAVNNETFEITVKLRVQLT